MSPLHSYSSAFSKSEILVLLADLLLIMFIDIPLYILYSEPRCASVYHRMFLEYIKASRKHYGSASRFIDDVLSLETEHLLTDPSLGEEETTRMMKLKSDFQRFIMKYIREKKLSGEVCTCIRKVLVCAAHICMIVLATVSFYDIYMLSVCRNVAVS